LVNVVCDTSFLIHLANNKIKNIENLDTDIGQIEFIVPNVVKNELEKLSKVSNKNHKANTTLDYIKNFKTITLSGNFADKSIIDFVKKNGGMVATVDKELKIKIKKNGGSIVSLSNNRIILES